MNCHFPLSRQSKCQRDARPQSRWKSPSALGTKYQFLTSEKHETIFSVGAGVEIGGTGQKRAGAETFSTWTAAVFFGKGLGDLTENLALLRPVAVTGLVGVAIPTSASTRSNGEIER